MLPVALTAFWIDDIITAQKNTFDADTLDGCLHFVCKLDCRVERTLTPGDLDNQNFERRSAIDSHPLAYPHLYLENYILNRREIFQLGSSKETHQQFRHSAAWDWVYRPVHPTRHYRILRERGRAEGISGVEGSAWSGSSGKKGRETSKSMKEGVSPN